MHLTQPLIHPRFHVMDLPAVDHLGYALNLIDATPFDVNAVRTSCVLSLYHR